MKECVRYFLLFYGRPMFGDIADERNRFGFPSSFFFSLQMLLFLPSFFSHVTAKTEAEE